VDDRWHSVALFIVGILLVLESERQRQRRDKRRQPPSMASGT